MANEKLTLYVLVTPMAVECDWKPLKRMPEKNKYRAYKQAQHPDVNVVLASTPGARRSQKRIIFAVMMAIAAAGLPAGMLRDQR